MNGGPMRSLLFVPGHQGARVDKALACGADAVIVDLEDAVPAEAKPAARANAAAARGRGRVFVRINGVQGGLWRDDLVAVVGTGLAGIVIPKAETAAEVLLVAETLGTLAESAGLSAAAIELLPLIESAAGVEALPAMARSSPLVRRLSFGVADYSLDLGLSPVADEAPLAYIRSRLTHVSRAAGLAPPIDSVVVEVRDASRFLDSARRARAFGMAGKLCLHPDQVPLAHEVFTPGEAELRWAHGILGAWREAVARGESSTTCAGEFVDAPVAARARQLLGDDYVG